MQFLQQNGLKIDFAGAHRIAMKLKFKQGGVYATAQAQKERQKQLKNLSQQQRQALEERQRKAKKQQEELKTKLYESMYNLGIKTWTTPNNVKITLVEEIPSSIIKEEKFDEETFKKDHLEEYQKYLIEVEKKKSGKKGYIRLTIGKEE